MMMCVCVVVGWAGVCQHLWRARAHMCPNTAPRPAIANNIPLCRFAADGDRDTAITGAKEAYQEAVSAAKGDAGLMPTHPIRLGLALNFSVFYYESTVSLLLFTRHHRPTYQPPPSG